jgi:hypothetical protein
MVPERLIDSVLPGFRHGVPNLHGKSLVDACRC